ncbi:hypothetical protein [Caballeronia jiangsuensis]|uniref:antitoxin PaaA2 family protein n=1 Tax=Caballeronia TaxID=1827195 RepID=UPI0038BB1538
MTRTYSTEVAYKKCFGEMVRASLDDPRPNVPHASVQTERNQLPGSYRCNANCTTQKLCF